MTDEQVELLRRMYQLAIVGIEAKALYAAHFEGALDEEQTLWQLMHLVYGERYAEHDDDITPEVERLFADDRLRILARDTWWPHARNDQPRQSVESQPSQL